MTSRSTSRSSGRGYTGLWTAYHLVVDDPTVRVAVIEREVAGFGASGRNGGWCSALFPASLQRMASERGRDAAVRMQHQLHDTVAAVGTIAAAEGIDCHFDQGGYLSVARNPAQLERVRAEVADFHAWGFGPEDHRLLDAHEVAEFAHVADSLGGSWTPHCAAIHPARLVRGLGRRRRAPRCHDLRAHVGRRRRQPPGRHARTARCGPSTSCSPPRATPRPSRVGGGRSPRSTPS